MTPNHALQRTAPVCHSLCFRPLRLSFRRHRLRQPSAVAELGVVRRRYARCVQRSLSPSLPFSDGVIHLSRLSSSQRASVPGTSSHSIRRSLFVSQSITHRFFPGVARRSCAQVTATGGSLPVPSQCFGRQSAALSTQAATPNHALQRTAPRVTVAAISSSDPSPPSVALSYVRCRFLRLTTQLPRRAPQSLSLGSLGVATRVVFNDTFLPDLSNFMAASTYPVVAPRSGSRCPARQSVRSVAVQS